MPNEDLEGMRDPLYVLAVVAHEKLGHDGRFKDCLQKVCISAIGALDSLDVPKVDET